MVGFVHHVGYGLFGKIGDSVYGSNLHLFVDGLCLCIECAAEDIGEALSLIHISHIRNKFYLYPPGDGRGQGRALFPASGCL